MSAPMPGDVRAEPNLTPLLDVVFQLITFFMLVFNISDQNYDERVKLPVAGSARPVEGKADEDKLIFNIDADGNLLWEGKVLDTERAIAEIGIQAQLRRLDVKVNGGKKLQPGDDLPTVIVVRSDRNTPFSQLYRIITACQNQGFRKFHLKAMTGES